MFLVLPLPMGKQLGCINQHSQPQAPSKAALSPMLIINPEQGSSEKSEGPLLSPAKDERLLLLYTNISWTIIAGKTLADTIPLPSSKASRVEGQWSRSDETMHRSNSPNTHGLLEDHCHVDRARTNYVDHPVVQQQTHPDSKLQGAHNNLGCHSTTGAASLGGTPCWGRGEATQQSVLITSCLLLCSVFHTEMLQWSCKHPHPHKSYEDEISTEMTGQVSANSSHLLQQNGSGLKHPRQ